MNKVKRNEKKERGEGGKERKYRGKIPTFFRRLVERRVEEKRIERNAVRSVIRPVASGERKNIEIDEIGGGWPPPLPITNWQKCIESRRFFLSLSLLSLYLIRESRSER